jgi:regulator of sigma E protease
MSALYLFASFVAALAPLIVVHEYGHYLAARLAGVKVLRFSVGFGRPILVTRRGADRTEWVLAAVPLGGYVKMLDEREAPVAPQELGRAFNRQSVWKRFMIVAAGPVFNFMFAIAVYFALYLHGVPEARPVVAAPAVGTLAQRAGFAAGDQVRSIDDETIETWQDFRWRVLQAALQRGSLRIEVITERNELRQLRLDLGEVRSDEVESDLLDRLGLQLYRPPLPPVLGKLSEGAAAQRAGLRAGDRIESAGGRALETWDDLVRAIRARPGAMLELGVVRDGLRLPVAVTPDAVIVNGERIGRIGAAPEIPPHHSDRVLVQVDYGIVTSLAKAAAKTWDISVFSLRMLGRMLLGEVSWKHLSGPVTIADYAGQSAQLGLIPFLTFLALISISLGVLNLLPIPLLDGGHLMYYCLEVVKGSPVSEHAIELGQRVGLALLLVVMAFALYNDFNRLFSG